MAFWKDRKSRLEKLLKSNIKKKVLDDSCSGVDENMLEHKLQLGENADKSIYEQIQSDLEKIMKERNSADDTESMTNTTADTVEAIYNSSSGLQMEDTDSRYVILEKVDENCVVSMEETKEGGITFHNPMLDSRNFEHNFFKKFEKLSTAPPPFSSGEKSLIISRPYARSQPNTEQGRYPGTLHFSMTAIDGYLMKSKDCQNISLCVEINGQKEDTPCYEEAKNIKLGYYKTVPIDRFNGPIKIKLLLLRHKKPSLFYTGKSTIVAQYELVIDSAKQLQNKLLEVICPWESYKSKNILRNMKKALLDYVRQCGTLKMHVSYLADSEIPSVDSPVPTDLFTLNKWLVIRKYTNELLFAGYANVCDEAGRWEKMYIKWYGFTVKLFDENYKRIRGTLNLADVQAQCDQMADGIILFKTGDSTIKLQCDSSEKLNGCIEALSILFPKSLAS